MAKRDLAATVVLILLLFVGIGVVASPFFLPEPCKLRLVVTDKVFNISPSKYARVPFAQLTDEREGETFSFPIVAAEGRDTIVVERIRSGNANLRLLVAGFKPKRFEVDLIPLTTNEVVVQLEPLFGRVRVIAVDVRTDAVREAARAIVDDIGEESMGSVLLLAPGEHSVRVQEDGFCAAEAAISVLPQEDKTIRLPISPELNAEEVARVTLSWNREPRDLDLHLLYDSTDIDSPHVFFGKKEGFIKSGGIFAELDIDHLQPGGTETITIYRRGFGSDQIFVHQFSEISTLGESGASIEVFEHDCRSRRFVIPRECVERWYHAFDIGVRHHDIELVEVGECLSIGPVFPDGRSRKR